MNTVHRLAGLLLRLLPAMPRTFRGRCGATLLGARYSTMFLIAGTMAGWGRLAAQDGKPSEYQVKAAYLYNFGKFVEWPSKSAANADPFSICVMGEDPFGQILDAALEGERAGGVPMTAKRAGKLEDAVNCRVVFISVSEERRLPGILAALDQAGVLTVSDISQFTKRGGMIQFLMDGGKVRFEVNLVAAQRSGLKFSSELLKLAVAVRRAP